MKTKNCSHLRMADGGFLSPLTRWANHLVGNNPAAMSTRGRTDIIEPATPTPAPAPVVQTPQPEIRFANGGGLRGADMYSKGSPHGGIVPGKGDGTTDTFDAKYAPGEFVMPADSAETIGYDQLQAMKDATHTPVEVQKAKKGLRMANGGVAGLDVLERPWEVADRKVFGTEPPSLEAAHGERVNPTRPNGRYGLPPNPEVPGVGAAAETAGTTASRAGPLARAGGSLLRGGSALVRGAGAAAIPAITGLEATKIAGTDTDEYARRAGVDRSGSFLQDLGLRAAGGMADLGNALTGGVADRVGNALSSGFNGGGFDFSPSAAAARPALPAAQATPDTPGALPQPAPTLRSDFAPPSVPTLNGQTGAAVPGAPEVSKFTQGGSTTYSNVPGENNTPGVSTAPGMSRALIDQTLGGNTAEQQTNDNAIMAANLRDGVDINRGTSKDPRNSETARLTAMANAPLGTPGKGFARQRLRDMMGDETTRRGQDLTAQGQALTAQTALRGQLLTNDTANKRLQYDIGKDQRDYTAQRGDKAFEQSEAADKNFNTKLESMIPPTVDAKGNSVVDKAAVAEHKAAVVSYVANAIKTYEAVQPNDPNYQRAQAAAKELKTKGVQAVDDKRLAQLIAQQEIKKRSADAKGLSPFSGTHIDSANPADYDVVGVDRGLFQDQYKLRGGGSVPTRTLDYDKGGNAVVPNFVGNNRTTRFDITKPQRGLRE